LRINAVAGLKAELFSQLGTARYRPYGRGYGWSSRAFLDPNNQVTSMGIGKCYNLCQEMVSGIILNLVIALVPRILTAPLVG
jgi:hypothetical protein